VSVGGREGERPPGDADGFRAYVRALRTPTLARALEGARMIREPMRFGFPSSRRRHLERAEVLPKRWLALGDAVCRFNPIYGQGMGVAALQAEELAASLQRTAAGTQAFSELGPSVVSANNAIIEAAWNQSAIPDFVYRQTTGERPRDLRERLLRTNAVLRLAVEDPEVHRLAARVTHLLDRPEVLRTHELNQRVRALMERGLGQAIVNNERS
jgi:2-polyprenyl-6-methoxyphenol hydroxylase-like FAD-dependent oxidoreductase